MPVSAICVCCLYLLSLSLLSVSAVCIYGLTAVPVYRARQGELFDYLTKMVKLSEKKTRHIMLQLLLAVNHMHQNNVVHRDLKVGVVADE